MGCRTYYFDVPLWRISDAWSHCNALEIGMLRDAIDHIMADEPPPDYPPKILNYARDLIADGVARKGPTVAWPPTGHRPHIPLDVRRAVMERDGEACVFCGSQERPELDHIIPFSRGGPDEPRNLRVLCKPCNVRRGAPNV